MGYLTYWRFLEHARRWSSRARGLVDERGWPQPWAHHLRRAARQGPRHALAFDELGIAHGERVAIISPNSGRFLTSYFG